MDACRRSGNQALVVIFKAGWPLVLSICGFRHGEYHGRTSGPFCAFVGNFRWGKGLDELVDLCALSAVNAVRDKCYSSSLVV